MAIDLSGYSARWTFSPDSGISNENGPWNGAAPIPSPHNYALIRNLGTIEQAFTAAAAGTYTISYRAQIRGYVNGVQSMRVKVDGTAIGTTAGILTYAWTPQSFTVALSAGAHVLRFEGLNDPAAPGNSGDETMLVDSVAIADPSSNPVALPNGNFDSFTLADGAYVFNPPAIATPSYRLVARVSTCGKWLMATLTKIADGSAVAAGAINEAPVLYVNGVSAGPLQVPIGPPGFPMLTTAAHAPMMIPLPASLIGTDGTGAGVAASAAVTLSASEGWITGPAGYAEAMAGQAATNCVGRSFVRTSDVPRTMKVGGGAFSHFVTPEWRNGVATLNQRYRIPYWNPTPASLDPGGKPLVMAAATSRAPIFAPPAVNNIDATGHPTPEGYWAIRWDGPDTYALDAGGDPSAAVSEVTSIANPGAGGLGKVRVFNFAKTGTATNFPVYVVLTVASGDLHTNFDNLEIRMPGDFSWTAGQPTTIGVSNWYDLPSVITDRIPPTLTGWSGFRYNDALTYLLGGSAACQRNHLVEPADFRWAQDVKVSYQSQFTQARPWNPAVTPYVYDPLTGTPYTATLGANIATTPAAGTVETITISDAATAPVLAGLELIIGSERMVVISVSGTAVAVRRGSASTTPTTHAAGTIQVSGRRAMTIAGAGAINKQIVELVTAAPHGLKTGQVPAAFAGNWPGLGANPPFIFTDGRGPNPNVPYYAGYSLECWVTGANTYLTIVDGPVAGSPNVTLGSTYTLDSTCTFDPAGTYIPEYGGCPHELSSAVAAGYPGSCGWVSIPPAASDDMVDEIFRRHFAYLPADRDMWIELGDEPWNFASRQAKAWDHYDYQLFGLSGTHVYWNGLRSCQVRDRGRAVATSLGRDPSKVKVFINQQPGASGTVPSVLSFLAGKGYTPDGFAFGPYYDTYLDHAIWSAFAWWPTDMLVDAWAWDFYSNTSAPGGFAWAGAQSWLTANWRGQLDTWNAAHGTNVELLIYEYAPQKVFPIYATSLGADMDATQTTLTLPLGGGANPDGTYARPLDNNSDDAAKVCPGTWLLVGTEWVRVASRSGLTCNVLRHQNGTTAAAHSAGDPLRNDWLEGTRDITLHPSYRIAHHDALAFFQSYGVSLMMPSALDQDWSGGNPWSDCHAIAQRGGMGDGSDGRFNNLLCLARPGQAHTKALTVNQDANTVSVRIRAMQDFLSGAVAPIPPDLSGWGYYYPLGAITSVVSWVDLAGSGFNFAHAKSDGSDLRVYDVTAAAFVPIWLMDFGPGAGRVYFRAIDVTHSHRLYTGNPAAAAVSSFATTFDGGSGFDADFGDLATSTAGAGYASQVPESAGPNDHRNYRVWSLAETPTLQYSDTGLGGTYTGVREMSLIRDAVTGLPIQIGGKYYITFARRSAVLTDKFDCAIASGISQYGPWSNFSVFYSPPGTIRLGYPSSVFKVGPTYVCYLSYGWDTGGGQSPGLTVYVMTSPDLVAWSTPVQALAPSIWTDPGTGLACTDCGNPWVIRCADGTYFMVVEGERTAAQWSCFGATATDPINGPWTAVNSGNALVTKGATGAWDSANGDANPKVLQLPDNSYVLQFNGSDDPTNSDWQIGYAFATSRDGPWTKATYNPTAGRVVTSYGFETSSLHMDVDGVSLLNYGQRFGDISTGSSAAIIYRMQALLRRGGLLVGATPSGDAAFMGRVMAAGTFTAESRSALTAHRASNATPMLLALMDYASVPPPATVAAFAGRRVEIVRWSQDFAPTSSAGPGDVTFRYYDSGGVANYWNGTAWTTSGTGRNLPADHSRAVVARISDDGANFVLSANYADDGTAIGSATIAKSAVAAFAAGRLLAAGDPLTDSWGAGQFYRYLHVRPYAATDPVATLGAEVPASTTPPPTPTNAGHRWLESGASRLLESGAFRLLEGAAAPATARGHRLLESGASRLLESGAFRLLEGAAVVPTARGHRLLESGASRLLESGAFRLLEGAGVAPPVPKRFPPGIPTYSSLIEPAAPIFGQASPYRASALVGA